MTTSTLELADALRDPAPPTPSRAAHASVHARARQIRRRHASGAIAGAACVALIAVGSFTLLGSGATRPGRVETAAAPSTVDSPTDASPDLAPAAPATTGVATSEGTATTEQSGSTTEASETSETTDTAPVVTAPLTAQIAVTVGTDTVPADVDLDATLTGDGGTFTAHVRTPGAFAFADVPTGDYELRWSWVSDDGTAQAVGRLPIHVDPGSVTFSL